MKTTILEIGPHALGESPVWEPDEQAFYWVDGLAPALFRMDWATRKIEQQVLNELAGSVTRAWDGQLMLALRSGLYIVRFGQEPELFIRPNDTSGATRFNDSKCDRHGRLLVGTMDQRESVPVGSAYQLRSDGTLANVDPNAYIVFNGPCWSVDNKWLYTSDSAGMCVNRFAYDVQTGSVGKKSLWVQLEQSDGLPDGATIDADGIYWQARNGAGKVVAHSPNGSIERELILPTLNVTSLAFGGPNLDVLMVTSMSRPLPWQNTLDNNSGKVFLVEGLTVRGLVEPRCCNQVVAPSP